MWYFEDHFSSKDIISRYSSEPEGVYLFYNPTTSLEWIQQTALTHHLQSFQKIILSRLQAGYKNNYFGKWKLFDIEYSIVWHLVVEFFVGF